MTAPSAVGERRARQLAAWDALWRLLLADEPTADQSAAPAAEPPDDAERESAAQS